jgi:copper chaperone
VPTLSLRRRLPAPDTAPVTYAVPGIACEHCRGAITDEVTRVAGVTEVEVDLERKLVRVHGAGIDTAAVVTAIDAAGYEAAVA